MDEPDQLLLNEEKDFLAYTPDKMDGTTGLKDPTEPYWKELCNLGGIDIKDLSGLGRRGKRHESIFTGTSGVFAYRRTIRFAEHYLQATLQAIESHLVPQQCWIFFS